MAKLMTAEQMRRLKRQWTEREQARKAGAVYNPRPVVKLFGPDTAATWLLAALSPDDRIGWAVVDLGLGFVEIGEVDMAELKAARGRLGLPIERDRWFTADRSVDAYRVAGAAAGRLGT